MLQTPLLFAVSLCGVDGSARTRRNDKKHRKCTLHSKPVGTRRQFLAVDSVVRLQAFATVDKVTVFNVDGG